MKTDRFPFSGNYCNGTNGLISDPLEKAEKKFFCAHLFVYREKQETTTLGRWPSTDSLKYCNMAAKQRINTQGLWCAHLPMGYLSISRQPSPLSCYLYKLGWHCFTKSQKPKRAMWFSHSLDHKNSKKLKFDHLEERIVVLARAWSLWSELH